MVHYRPKSPTSAYKTYLYLQAKIDHKANQTQAAKPTASPLLAVQGLSCNQDSFGYWVAATVRSWGLGVTTSGSETLLVKVPHAARNIGHMEDLSHGQELAALSQAALGQAEHNKLCSRPRLQVAYNYTTRQ
ncbi:hypothetical protein BHM03_00052872 [Ensete ventricosum]|nr:hypothetical protein BHM03_00052872 [Ensete ventricosum]